MQDVVIELLNMIFRKSSPDHYGKEAREQIQYLNDIQDIGAPQYISNLFPLLQHETLIVRTKSAEVIANFFGKLNSLSVIEDCCKPIEMTVGDIDYFTTSFSPERFRALLAIASFNKNGFVRQKSILAFEQDNNEFAIPYLLYRLNDWVPEVRKSAAEALLKMIVDRNFLKFASHINIVSRLNESGRDEALQLQLSILKYLASRELDAHLYDELLLMPSNLRLLFIKNYIERNGLTSKLGDLMVKDPYFLVRSYLIRNFDQLPDSSKQLYIKQLIKRKVKRIRIDLLGYFKRHGDTYIDLIFDFALDTSGIVREFSRLILKDQLVDWGEFYRSKITSGGKLLPALMGLSDVCSIDDVPVFEEHLQSDSVRIRIVCLNTIWRFDKIRGEEIALHEIWVNKGKFINSCIQILAASKNPNVLEVVRRRYLSGNQTERKIAVKIFNATGGWLVLADILKAMQDEDEIIRSFAWTYMLMWTENSRRLFTKAPEQEVLRAKAELQSIHISSTLPYHFQKAWEYLKFMVHRA